MKISVLHLKKPEKSLINVSITRFQNFESQSCNVDYSSKNLGIGLESINPVSQITDMMNLSMLINIISVIYFINVMKLVIVMNLINFNKFKKVMNFIKWMSFIKMNNFYQSDEFPLQNPKVKLG